MPPLGSPLIYEIYRIYRELQKTGTITDSAVRELAGKADEGEVARLRDGLAQAKAREENATRTLIESQAKWTNFARGILAVTKTLLGLVTSPQPVPTQKALIKDAADRVAKYESVLLSSQESLVEASEPTSAVPGGTRESEAKYTQEAVSEFSLGESVPVTSLNFGKIKDCLRTAISGDRLKVCALLQALRWRIANAPHGPSRRQEFEAFVGNDVLCITGSHDIPSLLTNIMMIKDRKYGGV